MNLVSSERGEGLLRAAIRRLALCITAQSIMLLLPFLLLPSLVLSASLHTQERPCPPPLLAISRQLLCLSSHSLLHKERCGCGLRRPHEVKDTRTKTKTNARTKTNNYTNTKSNTKTLRSGPFSPFLKMNRRKRGPRCMRSCLRHGMLHPAQCHALC